MIVGCYSLHLYCDFDRHEKDTHTFPHEFTGRTEGECFKDARSKGWKIYPKDDKAKCPRCVELERR